MKTGISARNFFCDEANEVLKIRAAANATASGGSGEEIDAIELFAGLIVRAIAERVILPDILCGLEAPARRDTRCHRWTATPLKKPGC
jgi:hypothetical protein